MKIFIREHAGESEVENATAALCKAIKRFPSLVTALMDKCGARLPPQTADHKFFKQISASACASEQSLEALIQLYVTRAYSVWKAQDVLDWFTVG